MNTNSELPTYGSLDEAVESLYAKAKTNVGKGASGIVLLNGSYVIVTAHKEKDGKPTELSAHAIRPGERITQRTGGKIDVLGARTVRTTTEDPKMARATAGNKVTDIKGTHSNSKTFKELVGMMTARNAGDKVPDAIAKIDILNEHPLLRNEKNIRDALKELRKVVIDGNNVDRIIKSFVDLMGQKSVYGGNEVSQNETIYAALNRFKSVDGPLASTEALQASADADELMKSFSIAPESMPTVVTLPTPTPKPSPPLTGSPNPLNSPSPTAAAAPQPTQPSARDSSIEKDYKLLDDYASSLKELLGTANNLDKDPFTQNDIRDITQKDIMHTLSEKSFSRAHKTRYGVLKESADKGDSRAIGILKKLDDALAAFGLGGVKIQTALVPPLPHNATLTGGSFKAVVDSSQSKDELTKTMFSKPTVPPRTTHGLFSTAMSAPKSQNLSTTVDGKNRTPTNVPHPSSPPQ
jgi:hypothetical protein